MPKPPSYLDPPEPKLASWAWALLASALHGIVMIALLALQLAHRPQPWTELLTQQLPLHGLSTLIIGALAWWMAREHRLRLREAGRLRTRLFEIIDCLPDATAVRDLEGKHAMWNQAAERFFRLRAEHAVGRPASELFPETLAQALANADQVARSRGETVERRLRLPAIYGQPERVAQLRVAPVWAADTARKLRGTVSTLKDITDQEAQALTLQREQARLAMAVEACGAGLWDWDLESDRVTYSPGFMRLLRYQGEDFRADFLFREHLHPEDRDRTLQAVQLGLREGMPVDRRYRLRCFDGLYRPFHGRGQPLTDAEGKRHFTGLLTPEMSSELIETHGGACIEIH